MGPNDEVTVAVTATLRKWAPGADPQTDEPEEVVVSEQLVPMTADELAAMEGGNNGA